MPQFNTKRLNVSIRLYAPTPPHACTRLYASTPLYAPKPLYVSIRLYASIQRQTPRRVYICLYAFTPLYASTPLYDCIQSLVIHVCVLAPFAARPHTGPCLEMLRSVHASPACGYNGRYPKRVETTAMAIICASCRFLLR